MLTVDRLGFLVLDSDGAGATAGSLADPGAEPGWLVWRRSAIDRNLARAVGAGRQVQEGLQGPGSQIGQGMDGAGDHRDRPVLQGRQEGGDGVLVVDPAQGAVRGAQVAQHGCFALQIAQLAGDLCGPLKGCRGLLGLAESVVSDAQVAQGDRNHAHQHGDGQRGGDAAGGGDFSMNLSGRGNTNMRGYGSGYGYGDGYANGVLDGYGDAAGAGDFSMNMSGRGHTNMRGYGSGYGYGDGWGRGYNYSAPYYGGYAPYGYGYGAPWGPAPYAAPAPAAPAAESE